MIRKLMKLFLGVLCTLVFQRTYSQSQSCPININFSQGTLTHWEAYTGNNKNGNGPSAIKMTYDSLTTAPSGTEGVSAIDEYLLTSIKGIQVLASPNLDPFGGFPTIPTINGY